MAFGGRIHIKESGIDKSAARGGFHGRRKPTGAVTTKRGDPRDRSERK
jgi:hypothetical protein